MKKMLIIMLLLVSCGMQDNSWHKSYLEYIYRNNNDFKALYPIIENPTCDKFLEHKDDISAENAQNFEWVSDIEQYGSNDYWTHIPDGSNDAVKRDKIKGDCEDYALHMYYELAAQWSAPSQIVIVKTEIGTHVVLLACGYLIDYGSAPFTMANKLEQLDWDVTAIMTTYYISDGFTWY